MQWVGLAAIGIGVLVVYYSLATSRPPRVSGNPASPTSSSISEPLVPTRTPIGTESPRGSTMTPLSLPVLPLEPLTRVAEITPMLNKSGDLWQGRPRWGVGVASGSILDYDTPPLRLGWYLDWQVRHDPAPSENVAFAQMIRLKEGDLQPDVPRLLIVARANPGALWFVGNEPDVIWQDRVEPVAYARLYHQAYTAIKSADPTAQVAIGGVSQPTPLRLSYLDAVLQAYRAQFGEQMPVDVWNVHNFILREERNSWGVEIPPGLADNQGRLYEIQDNASLTIFQQQIVDFRRWMAERGYRNRALIVSEYGIPMPADYGFPPERVAEFLAGTFDFFRSATDATTGYPSDDNRLVQRWCWYSLADTMYPTGNLFDPQTRQITPLGQAWVKYVGPLSR